jgi:pyridoxal phosphate enzyme (YggS family)
MVGRLQSNKIKNAVKLFDYIHSVDSFKIAKKISEEEIKIKKKVKIFLQVNVGDEIQKSGVKREEVKDLVTYCKKLNLNVLGLMCIPPVSDDPVFHFKYIKDLNNDFGFNELSMGMSSDYLQAVENSATFLRIGSNIFGARH